MEAVKVGKTEKAPKAAKATENISFAYDEKIATEEAIYQIIVLMCGNQLFPIILTANKFPSGYYGDSSDIANGNVFLYIYNNSQ